MSQSFLVEGLLENLLCAPRDSYGCADTITLGSVIRPFTNIRFVWRQCSIICPIHARGTASLDILGLRELSSSSHEPRDSEVYQPNLFTIFICGRL